MKSLHDILLMTWTSLGLCLLFYSQMVSSAIYGADNRKETLQCTEPVFDYLKEINVALIDLDKLIPADNGYKLKAKPYYQLENFCTGIRFGMQPTGAFCSGFFVSPKHILTAGHCLNQSSCTNTAFAQNFVVKNLRQDDAPVTFKNEEVYFCKEVISRHYDKDGADFALVEVDRPLSSEVLGARYLWQGSPADQELGIIGHPHGIPAKIATNGFVTEDDHPDYFIGELDALMSNSGSAVFSLPEGKIVGILVRGAEDFIQTRRFHHVPGLPQPPKDRSPFDKFNPIDQPPMCMMQKQCRKDQCKGVEVVRLSTVKRYSQKLGIEIDSLPHE